MRRTPLTGLGQTTANSSAADLEAMNAPPERLPELCRAGNALACRLANLPASTPEELATRAAERDRQAQAEREALARKAAEAGLNPQLVTAIRAGQDVHYATREEVARSEELRRRLAEQNAAQQAQSAAFNASLAAGFSAAADKFKEAFSGLKFGENAAPAPQSYEPLLGVPQAKTVRPWLPWAVAGGLVVAAAGVGIWAVFTAPGGER